MTVTKARGIIKQYRLQARVAAEADVTPQAVSLVFNGHRKSAKIDSVTVSEAEKVEESLAMAKRWSRS